jgi:L-threonylcarbamoyladenylate synthase
LLVIDCETGDLTAAAKIVRKGGVIVYPTDTVYGIGCDIHNGAAVERVIHIKKRLNLPLPVLCANVIKAEELVHLDGFGRNLASKFWPGGLTIVAGVKNEKLPIQLTGGTGTLGVRVPDHRGASKIITLCGGHLVGTSANISGKETPDTVEGVIKMLGEEIDALVVGGEKPLGIPSSVVDVVNGSQHIIREGMVPADRIKDLVVRRA